MPTNPITKDRVRGIFSFLREVHLLRSKLIRRVDEHHWHLELGSLADDPRITCTRDSSAQAAEETFRLTVERVTLEAPPRPPEQIRPYLPKGWDDPTRGAPVLALPDEPETALRVQGLFEAWAPHRAVWAEACQPDLSVHRAFQQLYEVWARLERESESWDLVLADVLLSAPANDQGGRIEHPLLLQRVGIHFDADAGIIEIAEGDAEPRLHGAVLRVSAGLSDVGLPTVQHRLADGCVRLNEGQTVAEYARFLVASLFPQEGRFLEQGECRDQGISVRTAPMLVLMRRIPGIGEAIDRYLGVLDQLEDLPAGLRRVVGDFAEGEWRPRSVISTDEVLLTKHANADQEQIVRRLEAHGSVLVQGPPGTGKTHTIANLIGHLLAHGKTVLVTSHTTKALRVVRDQVVEELRPLCVSVLERDTAARNELEASIGGIVSEFTRTSPAQLDAEISAGRDLRNRLLKRIAALEASFRETCQVRCATLECAGRTWELDEAARFLREREPVDGWIPGAVDNPAPLTTMAGEVERLYQLNAALTDDQIKSLLLPLPDVREFVTADALQERLDLLAALVRGEATPAFAHQDARTRPEVLAAAGALGAVQELRAAGEQFDGWLRVVAEDAIVGGGRAAVWTELTTQVTALRERAVALAMTAARLRPTVKLDWTIRDQVQVAWEVHGYVRGGSTIGLWVRLSQSRWWTFVLATSVDGRAPRTAEEFEGVAALLELQRDRTALAEHWDRIVGRAGGPPAAAAPGDFVEAALVWSDDLKRVVEWATSRWDLAVAQARGVPGFNAEPDLVESRPTDLELPRLSVRRFQLQRLEAALRAFFLDVLSSGIETWLTNAVSRATRAQVPGDATGVGRRILDSLRQRDVATYRRERGRLAPLSERRLLVLERNVLLDKLVAGAPEWARALANRTPPHNGATAPGPVDAAVAWRRLQGAFDTRMALDPVAIQREISDHRRDLRLATAEYVRAKAWRAQRDRVDGARQQRLVGWVDTVRRIGRGTGIRAPRLIAEARRLLAECRDSVPVWIMPLAQALESYDLSQSNFDVVIIDEASQLDVVGVVALALGKQVVVVGDHEQVSPSAVGQQVAPVDALQRQYLQGVPNAHLYVGQTSVYDLARQSFGEMIRLREHFRCAREIIEFSNQLCYGGEIVALRDTSSVAHVPHVVQVRTMGVRHPTEKVNHMEAERVVALLVAMIEAPEYRDCTFGVISLVGEEQALLIDRLVARWIPPQERQRRRLVCGTAAQFQGDERQVMLLSMVDSGTGQGPLRLNDRPEFKQRLNVAASRAQNQQWVVHSLNPSVDLQAHDLRRRFLEYAVNARGYVETLKRALDDAEKSHFEREVERRLLAKGYRLIPQFPVGAYRIDIVCEGAAGKRLAVECDGDRWHGLDRTEADMERQNLLERLGWRFHRIRGGAYYRDPEAEILKLEAALADRDIAPVFGTSEAAEGPTTLAERVMSRSAEIIAEWSVEDGPPFNRGPAPPGNAAVRGPQRSSPPTPTGPESSAAGGSDSSHAGEYDSTDERIALHTRRAPGPVEEHAAALLARLGSAWLSRADLLALVPLSVPQWNLAIHELVDGGHVEARGEKRGRRYRLAGNPGALDRPLPLPRKPQPTPTNDTENGENTPRDAVKAALRAVDPGLSSARCPECGSRCELFVGRRGPFLKCQNHQCEDSSPVQFATLVAAVTANPSWRCVQCGGNLHVLEQPTRTLLECSSRHQEAWKVFRDRIRGGGAVVAVPPRAPAQLRLLGGVARDDDAD